MSGPSLATTPYFPPSNCFPKAKGTATLVHNYLRKLNKVKRPRAVYITYCRNESTTIAQTIIISNIIFIIMLFINNINNTLSQTTRPTFLLAPLLHRRAVASCAKNMEILNKIWFATSPFSQQQHINHKNEQTNESCNTPRGTDLIL